MLLWEFIATIMKRSEFLKGLIVGGVAASVPAITAVASVPAPLSFNEIKLCSPLIAGFRYYEGEANVEEFHPGDNLTLIREPKNPHDRYAIEVYRGTLKLGYIPRVDNKVVARMMDQQVPVMARIRYVNPDEDAYSMVRIRVFFHSPAST